MEPAFKRDSHLDPRGNVGGASRGGSLGGGECLAGSGGCGGGLSGDAGGRGLRQRLRLSRLLGDSVSSSLSEAPARETMPCRCRSLASLKRGEHIRAQRYSPGFIGGGTCSVVDGCKSVGHVLLRAGEGVAELRVL